MERWGDREKKRFFLSLFYRPTSNTPGSSRLNLTFPKRHAIVRRVGRGKNLKWL
jgi:hypothetical protein